ncbi:MAG: hypothetical protein JWR86_2037, partial [Enterovirga sp.]|nr:hypothetical protein [Enterovirga sp.]
VTVAPRHEARCIRTEHSRELLAPPDVAALQPPETAPL